LTTSAGDLKRQAWCVCLRLLSLACHRLPSGPGWVHEIKHDGFRLMVRLDGAGIRLITRNGHDWSGRFPLIAEAAGALKARSFLLDGEAVACDGDGLPSFDRLRYRRGDSTVFLFAFDLLELNGDDLRREPLEVRKATLASVLAKAGSGLRLNEHLEHDDGEVVFRHACKLGLEGIVSKRKDLPYRSGRSSNWLKMKNPDGTSGEAGKRRTIGAASGARALTMRTSWRLACGAPQC
jgi:bifunctional non-homologous end joining protein LigD